MGKLHKLRRTIERDPKKWLHRLSTYKNPYPFSAVYTNNQWVPNHDALRGPYRNFVRKVLEDLGLAENSRY